MKQYLSCVDGLWAHGIEFQATGTTTKDQRGNISVHFDHVEIGLEDKFHNCPWRLLRQGDLWELVEQAFIDEAIKRDAWEDEDESAEAFDRQYDAERTERAKE